MCGLVRTDQVWVPAVKGVRCEVGVDGLGPGAVRRRVIVGVPRGKHLNDEVWFAR